MKYLSQDLFNAEDIQKSETCILQSSIGVFKEVFRILSQYFFQIFLNYQTTLLVMFPKHYKRRSKMNFQSYLNYFNEIMENSHPAKPYDNPAYVDFVKLNQSRVNRWLKHGIIDKRLQHVVKKIDKPQRWIIITEPWCGDAAQIVPFIQRMAELNPLIQTDYELRDSPPFRINQYLTDGRSKSIPMLVAKDENGNDIFKWGPRPQPAQSLYKGLSNKKAGFEQIKIALQQWYNKDKGQTEEHEIEALLTAIPE